MIFFPIRTDARLSRRPWVNLSLIAANVVVLLFTLNQHIAAASVPFQLNPAAPRLYQFITYQFLHAGPYNRGGDAMWPMHIIGNMVFLYVFGNSVEDRLGKIGYLAFYLAGGVVAGLGHAMLEGVPVYGASGSVAAVTGAYLALFPQSGITIAYWFFFYVGTFEVSGIVLILFQVAENVVLQVTGAGHVAYLAHLWGYGYGFVIGMGLLLTRLLPREPYDLIAMIDQRRRRMQFRLMTQQGFRPWESERADEAAVARVRLPGKPDQALMDLRARITAELANHQLDHAADLYEDLLERDPSQVMGPQPQLDIANQLMSLGRYPTAARAYELFLNTHHSDPQREQVELILGLLYARYLDRRQRARELLTAAMTRLHDPQQKALAQQVLTEIG